MKDDALLGTPVERFSRTMFTRIITNLARTLRTEDFSVAQIAALYLLDERGALRIGELAREIDRSQPSASRLVDGLVLRGLIARKEQAGDRRVRVVTLTPKARAIIAKASVQRARTILDTTSHLSRDVLLSIIESRNATPKE